MTPKIVIPKLLLNGLDHSRRVVVIAWLLFCAGYSTLHAQQASLPTPDITLEKLLQAIETSPAPAKLEYQLALLKRYDASTEQRDKVASDLIAQFEGHDAPAVLAAAYAAKGRVHADRTEFSEAEKVLAKAEVLARQNAQADPQLLFRILCNRATFLNVLGDQSQAARLLRQAIELAKPREDQFELAFAYSVLAHIAEAAGAIDKSFEYFKLAFESATKNKKTEIAAQVGINMIELAISEDDYPMARELLSYTEPWIEKSTDQRVLLALKLRKQDLRSRESPREAAAELERMISDFDKQSDPQSLGLLYLSLAGCRLNAGEYETALQAADSASEYLKPMYRSWTFAQLRRLRALFGLGQVQQALDGVDSLLADTRLVTVHRIELLEFRSSLLAGLSKFQESLDALSECRKLESDRDTKRAQELAQFIKGTYDDQQRELELSTAKARQAAAEAQAELSVSVAKRQSAEIDRAKLMRNGSIVLSALALLSATLYIRATSKRRTAAALARRERELNDELKQRLSDQATELQEQVTTRQQLELAMERKFRDEALGKLTGGVAHDFNNLLTVILHSIELIRTKHPQLPVDTVALLEAITSSAESGTSIVNQLMAYTRQQPLEPKPLKVADWLAATRTMHRQMIGKSIHFIEHDHCGEATICIDAAQLTTAVINLLANARDALTSPDGTIEFTVQAIELNEKNATDWRGLRPGRYCLFEVRDTGKGMTQAELAHACEPFFTTKKQGSGTGLGLSTVSGFVKQSGGEFRLTSAPGLGTVASFLLPLTQLAATPTPSRSEIRADASYNQVLLVEDQEAVRTVLAAGLKSIGYTVTQACHADEAVNIIERCGAPQILLSDVRMPGSMNGVELRRWVLSRYPHVHVVLMSGYRDLDSDYEPNLLFMQKPVKLQDLHRVLSMQI